MVEGVVDQRQDGSGSCLESPGQSRSAFWADDTDPARRYIGRVRVMRIIFNCSISIINGIEANKAHKSSNDVP